MFYLASDIKIITSEVKTDQLSHLIISPQSIGIKMTSVHMQKWHNTAEWTILILFTLVGPSGSSRRNKANWSIYFTFTVSSSLTGWPHNLRLASIHIQLGHDVHWKKKVKICFIQNVFYSIIFFPVTWRHLFLFKYSKIWFNSESTKYIRLHQ